MSYIILIFYGFLMTVILVYCLLELSLAIHYLFKKQRQEQTAFTVKTPDLPNVTIQLPIFNELYVVERIIDAVAKFDYPKDKLQIQVLDDSTDETLELSRKKVQEKKDEGIDIELIHRTDRTGYKAGALHNAMQKCKGEYIAIFDADFIPNTNFLLSTLPYFDTDSIGLVQTRWQHINRSYSLLTRIQAFFLDAHFTVEQGGRNKANLFINFNGTAGIWRKNTIEDAGGWHNDTITEDLDLSYRAQLKNWRFVYLEHHHSPAELPADIRAIKSQQFRWIKGGAEVARKLLPQVMHSKQPFRIKLNSFSHLLSSSMYIVILFLLLFSLPVMIAKSNIVIQESSLKWGYIYYLSTISIAIIYFISNWNSRSNVLYSILSFIPLMPLFLIFTMGLSLHNGVAALRGLMREETPFIRTPKFNINNRNDNWVKNKYNLPKIDLVSLLEFAMLLYLGYGIYYSFQIEDLTMLPLLILGFTGYFLVLFYTVMHWLKVQNA